MASLKNVSPFEFTLPSLGHRTIAPDETIEGLTAEEVEGFAMNPDFEIGSGGDDCEPD